MNKINLKTLAQKKKIIYNKYSYKNILGGLTLKNKFLENLTIDELKDSYKEYLNILNIKRKTRTMYLTNAFYLHRNDNSIDFLELLQNDNFEDIAIERLEYIIPKIFKGNPKNIDENIRFFFSHIKRLKRYVDSYNKN